MNNEKKIIQALKTTEEIRLRKPKTMENRLCFVLRARGGYFDRKRQNSKTDSFSVSCTFVAHQSCPSVEIMEGHKINDKNKCSGSKSGMNYLVAGNWI